MLEIQQFEPTRPLERPFEIPEHVVDLTWCQKHSLDTIGCRRTFAITTRSERLLDTALATSNGLVSHRVPWRSEPSGSVMVIESLGCAKRQTSIRHTRRRRGRTHLERTRRARLATVQTVESADRCIQVAVEAVPVVVEHPS